MNRIGWCTHTINPITGCGNFGNKKICGDYCYAARMAKRLAGRCISRSRSGRRIQTRIRIGRSAFHGAE